jgi:Kef-type K+ transport system membrane component KefB
MPEHYSPLAGFVIAAISAIAMPRLMERLRLPAVLGYIAAGVLIGPAMLGVVQKDGAVITWLAEIGKLLFMFFVGFEIDLALFKSTRARAVVFGSLTFAIPLAAGIFLGRVFGYSWVASLLIGSIIASHTLLAYPILQRLGVLGNEAISVTISGTIFTDIAAMLVLAVAVSVHERGFTWSFLGVELIELAIFVPAVMFGLSRLARAALIRFGQAPEARLVIVMTTIAVAAEAGRLIQLEGIVGAFLAGISMKRALRGRFAVEQLEVTAQALFIPAFFLTTGFLVDLEIVKQTVIGQPGMVIALIGTTLGAKWLAARLTGLCFSYSRAETLSMASLSFPQMAATLASAVVGYQALNSQGERLLDAGFVNAVVLLVIVTCVLGPVLTRRFAAQLPIRSGASQSTAETTTDVVPATGIERNSG